MQGRVRCEWKNDVGRQSAIACWRKARHVSNKNPTCYVPWNVSRNFLNNKDLTRPQTPLDKFQGRLNTNIGYGIYGPLTRRSLQSAFLATTFISIYRSHAIPSLCSTKHGTNLLLYMASGHKVVLPTKAEGQNQKQKEHRWRYRCRGAASARPRGTSRRGGDTSESGRPATNWTLAKRE
jgi:hypothetical protein